jgi:glyoxylase-like metal-dependent hydrolase (beta-lactamase superfamily II)
MGSVNAYVFLEPVPTLLDTGLKIPASLDSLRSGLGEVGLSIKDLERVIISHPHIDHFGAAGYIAAHSQATFYTLAESIPALQDYQAWWIDNRTRYEGFAQRLGFSTTDIAPMMNTMAQVDHLCDPLPPARIEALSLEESLRLGQYEWQILHPPGHASTLLCFYHAETQTFLSTDMLLHVTPTPIVEWANGDLDRRLPSLAQFLDSLARVEGLAIEQVYPGHGNPFSNPAEVIAAQRIRIAQRQQDVLDLVAQGHHTAPPLLDTMYHHYPPAYRFPAFCMLVGYLDLLLADGRLRRTQQGGVWHYHLTKT